MQISRENFGVTMLGQTVSLFRLSHEDGSFVSLINYGAAVQAIVVPDRNGNQTDVCLGYNSIMEYENAEDYSGATIGRCANRIGNSVFSLNGKKYHLAANNGPNHLHGGVFGFDKRVFDYIIEEDSILFSYLSVDGEEGYPGNLNVTVRYSFTKDHELIINYEAQCDQDTLVSLTNHTYFNLNGESNGTILDHVLWLYASIYTAIDENGLPNGKILPVFGTPFDFTKGKEIGKDIDSPDVQLGNGNGYDHHYVLDKKFERQAFKPQRGVRCRRADLGADESCPAAALYSPHTGIKMKAYTTKPGVQLYSGNFLHTTAGKSGTYTKRSGLCLETQFLPDAINNPEAQSPVLKQGDKYTHRTKYVFNVSE